MSGAHRAQKKVLDSWELELQLVAAMLVLGTIQSLLKEQPVILPASNLSGPRSLFLIVGFKKYFRANDIDLQAWLSIFSLNVLNLKREI